MKKQFITTFVAIFILLTVVLYMVQNMDPAYKFSLLESGNVILFVLTMGGYLLVNMQLNSTEGAFIRGVSGASFLKLMVCMSAILIYVVLNRASIHKPSIFVLFGIYAVYTAFETVLLSKLARTVK